MADEYHQKGGIYFRDNLIYKYYDIDREADEKDKIHYLKNRVGTLNLNVEDVNIKSYTKRLFCQDASSLKKKDKYYKYFCIFLFTVVIGFFIKEMIVLFKYKNDYLNSLMEKKPFSKEILNWYKVKESQTTGNKILHIVIIFVATIVLSVMVNYLFHYVNLK